MHLKFLNLINAVLESKGEPPIENISSELHLRKDLGFDSFDLAELTVRIEEEFGVDVFAEGIINTIGEIEKIISKSGK